MKLNHLTKGATLFMAIFALVAVVGCSNNPVNSNQSLNGSEIANEVVDISRSSDDGRTDAFSFTGTVYDIDYEKSVILMDDGKVIVVFNKETRFVVKNGRFESTVDATRVESGMTATVFGKKEADSIIYADRIEIELEMRSSVVSASR